MKAQHVIKRGFDLIISAIGLVVLSPLLALIALAIKINSPGPVFFCQKRLGRDGKIFRLFKFRSMVVGAGNGMVKDAARDPRITPVGAFIRKWSLDELPQLWNVLRGEMSLVGPRPDRVFRLPDYTEERRRRLLMKPGITGLAQVNGRNAISWEERYRLDIAYVDNWSLWLDLKILFKTFHVVLSGSGVDYE
jgi:exopolysaccharide biosynthesis polyprenyl glycosylphosphotransferase